MMTDASGDNNNIIHEHDIRTTWYRFACVEKFIMMMRILEAKLTTIHFDFGSGHCQAFLPLAIPVLCFT